MPNSFVTKKGIPFISISDLKKMYVYFKRVFDFFSALSLLIAISPVFIVLAFFVKINLGSPIFFKQARAGKGMKPFDLMKFRTMKDQRDEKGDLLPDEYRQTKFGSMLRSSSLDELPELIHIIKGEMSVIGPRPLPMKYNPYYREEELRRFDVRGGLITPDSVDESPIISWDKQLKYEADYAKDLCFSLDLKIFISVFKILFKRQTSEYGSFIRKELNIEREYMFKS